MEDVRTKTNGTTNTNQTGPIVLPALDTSNVTTTTGIDATPAAALQTEAAGGAAGAGGKVPPECRDNSRGLHDDPHSDDSVESGIYVVSTPGGQYVGQSGNISNRLGQHVAKGKFTQEEVDSAQRFAVPGTKLDREVAEPSLSSWWLPVAEIQLL